MSIELAPGQAVIAELTASRGVMKVRIEYNAYLVGQTAVNYNPTFKDHHFWGLGIGGVMAAANNPNSVKSTEEIEIGYYSNSRIVLRDAETKTLKAAFSMADAPGA